ncbi:peptidyl-prolyl cis-trans isomerase FKBP4-like [Schistocerca gregaria]|uniref:peptidyl-prolyl cis-trans isomerase FKBP4-like n=1 Tax=Schistocerca gregaria TaxID=7010 RepID=UPI00211EEE68|nr:peptidyl-prolyl cis-trans isomerase FKBP4-like [Schistocerca gregaria]
MMNECDVKPAAEEVLKQKPEDLLMDGGILKTILREGEGEETPREGSEVSVHYTGVLVDGTKFDSSLDRGQPFKFVVGEGKVIKGWDKTLLTMRRGEKCSVVLEPKYAYGESGSPPKIPPNATLKFEIELLDFTNATDVSKKKDGSVMKTTLKSPEKKSYEKPNFGATCTIAYSVARLSGDVLSPEQQLTYVVDEGRFPKAVETAVKSLVQGERAKFTIKPEQAYADEGCPALNIPAGETTVWTIELFDLQKLPSSWNMDLNAKLEAAESGKQRGNELFSLGKYKYAAKRYKNSLSYIEYTSGEADPEVVKKINDLKSILNLNISQCYLNLKNHKEALKAVEKVLEKEPNNIKALYRRGMARMMNQDWDLAKEDFRSILQQEPNQRSAICKLNEANAKIKLQNEKDRAIFSKMFH